MSDSAHSTRGTAARGNKDPGVGTGGGEKASSPAKKGKKVGKASTPETPMKDPLEETPGMNAAEDSGEADQSADATEENSKPAAGAKEKDSQLAAGTTEVNSTRQGKGETKGDSKGKCKSKCGKGKGKSSGAFAASAIDKVDASANADDIFRRL